MAAYSIVVVAWQSARHLVALVESMNRSLDSPPELVVVDNASSDDPEREASAWRGPTTFVRRERNDGYGTGANAGVEAASSAAIVLLNPDTELVDDGLGELAALAIERRALAGPRMLNPDGSIQPSASGSPVGMWPWIGAVIPGRIQPTPVKARTEPWRLHRTVHVAWLAGACVAGPRDALLKLGPFDPDIDMYSEDMDLGLRAASAGIPSLFCPSVCHVIHHGRGSAALRFPDGPQRVAALNRRAVIRRAFGERRERRARRAQRMNLRLRVLAKRALRRDSARDSAELSAALSATTVPELGPPPGPRT